MRARIDVSEIEAQTKIRAKYLRALENEEWSLLPGPTFVKSFLRTYAQALGLDGKSLVEEYRLSQERPSEAMLEPIVSPSQRNRNRNRGRGRSSPRGPSRGYTVAVVAILLVIVILIVLLATGGSPKSTSTRSATITTTTGKGSTHTAAPAKHPSPAGEFISLSLTPTAPVYVCLIGDNARKLIPGLELQPGGSTATYHARHFELVLGNNSVTLTIDGRVRPVAPSTRAIGYSITKARGRQPLAAAQLPTCK